MTRRHFLASSGAALAQTKKQPNVVLIFADDLGYGDLGCFGGTIRTPNLDRMAKQGMRFTRWLSANPVCSPSRASLLTGRYPTRVGVPRVLFPYDKTGLAAGEKTIGSLLQEKGYATGCVGKWHLGHLPEFLPPSWGFDQYFGIPYSNDMNPPVLLRADNNKTETVEARADMNTLQEKYTREAVQFIEGQKSKPFFLYMPHTFPHIPLGASAKFRGKSAQGLYGDVVEELDWSVGEVFGALKRNGLERDTLVIFTSDNGPWHLGSPGGLRGRKGGTYEGGMRVPAIVRMPGKVAAGKVSEQWVSSLDVLPTVASLTGASLPQRPLDGVNLWPVLSGKQAQLGRDAYLYFDGWNAQCIREGNYKLHISRYNVMAYNPAPPGGKINLPLASPELYNLETDPDESYDIAPENPQKVKELLTKHEQMLSSFPEEVKQAWAETKGRKSAGSIGAVPRTAN
ncbi:MAG: sulfatase [Bryobacter sp.]|nr:sulfatase [Bryobacter sp.]